MAATDGVPALDVNADSTVEGLIALSRQASRELLELEEEILNTARDDGSGADANASDTVIGSVAASNSATGVGPVLADEERIMTAADDPTLPSDDEDEHTASRRTLLTVEEASQFVKDTLSSGAPFYDTEFDVCDASRVTAAHSAGVQRIGSSCSGGEGRLFQGEPSPDDIVEGQLGDCFFLAAVSVLAQRPQRVFGLFLNPVVNDVGVYGVKFFYNDEWVAVVVDDRYLTNGDGRPLYGRNSDDTAFWVTVLEKAYAKLYGSYSAICGGNVSEALRDLTGDPVRDFNLHSSKVKPLIEKGKLLRTLQRSLTAGACVGTARVVDPDSREAGRSYGGVYVNHAYGVLAAEDKTTITVRNPWGKGNGTKEGTFTMTWANFTTNFNRLYICTTTEGAVSKGQVSGEWSQGSGGHSSLPTWPMNPQFSVVVRRPCRVQITLSQPDLRVKDKLSKGVNYEQIGMSLVQPLFCLPDPARKLGKKGAPPTSRAAHGEATGAGAGVGVGAGAGEVLERGAAEVWSPDLASGKYETIAKTSFWNKREVSLDVELKPSHASRPYLLVPSTYFPGHSGEFTISYSAMPVGTAPEQLTGEAVQVMPVDWGLCLPFSACFETEWAAKKSCGGLINAPNFTTNPQLLLTVGPPEQPGQLRHVLVTLSQQAVPAKSGGGAWSSYLVPAKLGATKPFPHAGVHAFDTSEAISASDSLAHIPQLGKPLFTNASVVSRWITLPEPKPQPEPAPPAEGGGVGEGEGPAVVMSDGVSKGTAAGEDAGQGKSKSKRVGVSGDASAILIAGTKTKAPARFTILVRSCCAVNLEQVTAPAKKKRKVRRKVKKVEQPEPVKPEPKPTPPRKKPAKRRPVKRVRRPNEFQQASNAMGNLAGLYGDL